MDEVWDSLVIGAGAAGLSAAYHLGRRGVRFVLLDANPAPGGAWQHRWSTLRLDDLHGVAALPDASAPGRGRARARDAVPAVFARYEHEHRLPIRRPVRVLEVRSHAEDLLSVDTDAGRWWTRTLVNATGTWGRPFVPHYPGMETFTGRQWHTADYRGPEELAGSRVVVVGGGASAVQLLGEVAPVAETLWVTRRPPVWRTTGFDAEAGRHAVGLVEQRVRAGLAPTSVVTVTGLALREQEQQAARLGAYRRRPMFARVEPSGVRWADGSYEPVDGILWATGFRPDVAHLAGLRLRSEHGGIALTGPVSDRSALTQAVADPRVQLVGYGPSASTVGANRAGRVAARNVRRHLAQAAGVAATV